jgi:urease accessory protein
MDWLPRLLQSSDSFFPSGSFAHSFGLEGMTQLGVVRDPESLGQFLETFVLPVLEHVELPFVALAFEAAARADVDRLRELNARYGAMKSTRELREASARIGAQRLGILRELSPHPLLERLQEMHAALVFGMQCALAGAPVVAALSAYYYQTLAAFVSASIKLIRIGHLGCQKILTRCLDQSDAVIERAQKIAEDDIGWFNPLLDIASARHEFAEARLFIS